MTRGLESEKSAVVKNKNVYKKTKRNKNITPVKQDYPCIFMLKKLKLHNQVNPVQLQIVVLL